VTSHITDADIDRYLDRDCDEHEQARVRTHLEACAECRAQWDDVLRAHDAMATRRLDVPDDLAARAVAAARSRGAQVRPRPRWMLPVARAAAILLAIGVGAAGERLRATAVMPPATDAAQNGYLFVFSGTQAGSLTPESRAAIARSFRTWTDSLTRTGQMLAVGQLTRDAPRLVAATEPNLDSATVRAFASMEGFYVLLARDDADALALARSCPYLRFGGTIVVRRRVGGPRQVATVARVIPSERQRVEESRSSR
jgi:predicted anti-sigma-YlaC factor YlaD